MSDVHSDSYIAPYPPENLYGIGVAGPSSTTNHAANSEDEVEKVAEESTNVENEEVNNAEEVSTGRATTENLKLEEHLGNNIDTTA